MREIAAYVADGDRDGAMATRQARHCEPAVNKWSDVDVERLKGIRSTTGIAPRRCELVA